MGITVFIKEKSMAELVHICMVFNQVNMTKCAEEVLCRAGLKAKVINVCL